MSDHEMEVDDAPKDKGKQKVVPEESFKDDTLPWVEKYRPVTLSDVVSHQDITSTNSPELTPLTVIEQYTRNVRFCIICNYVNKITPAIQSRCTRFRFSPLPIPEVEKRIDLVIENEKVNVTPEGKQALLKLSKGDMRRALNVLQVRFLSNIVFVSPNVGRSKGMSRGV
ncbi:Replication factor C subunit 3 Short=Replication factor C3 [Rhizoctonia solani AG-1 IB]|uniref:Replication factor C subunit 3 Short=Replication factor C3 n=1 Tax=Thanatephorus cucumeris (strain AG1-IB / isolate 7/3/14) TaxID=1108050 RepID=M5BXE1_THACB|nr:Replication factor C subunit 3 Short=Replication factor C3 [Rhizoctonia solani AG-1 IB]